MKITNLLGAAGLAIAAMGISTSADAQSWGNHGRDGYRDNHRGHDRYDRRDRGRHYGWDRGHRYGWNHRRVRCWTEWRYHHRVRICR
jgi:hypothetical protein